MRKPIIGLVPLVDAERESFWMLPGYMEGVQDAGGLPVMLPLTDSKSDAAELASLCDGFLYTGGHDVSPSLYGEEPLPECGELCPGRDGLEVPLLLEAMARDKPVLGICRGLQLINTALGGTLYQDLPTQRPSACEHHMAAPYDRPEHMVRLAEHSPLKRLLQAEEIGVNSCHHQGVKRLAPSLNVMAEAPDGLVEAVCAPESRFVWAVQWHPEFSRRVDENSRKLFEAFVQSCL